MQKTKTTNRVLSLVLALLMVLSLFPAITLNVSAADGDEPANSTMLEPGTYITTLYRLTSCTDSTILKTATEHFSSQAILTINDDLSQTVTIGVEHWSLYEAFVPAKQSSNETGFTVLPAAVFNSENKQFYYTDTDETDELPHSAGDLYSDGFRTYLNLGKKLNGNYVLISLDSEPKIRIVNILDNSNKS